MNIKGKNLTSGITLVALTITIVILLILAGISISALTDSNLFEKIKQAKSESEQAEKNQGYVLGEYEQIINEYKSEILTDEKMNVIISENENTYLKDENGNMFVLPAGFKVKVDEDTNYSKTVDKGIVIIDKDENEFVWIPVGTVTKLDNSTVNIKLNRYQFDSNGVAIPQNDEIIDSYYQELEISIYGNTTAKSIETFKKSAIKNGGYYIGRYEARTEKLRKAKDDKITIITEKGRDYIYNWVTQPQAAKLAGEMYLSSCFTSDLINSYAWDTTILFLQLCGENPIYSRQESINQIHYSRGSNNEVNQDVQCNIFDMASNSIEWTTETSNYVSPSNINSSVGCRGGFFHFRKLFSSERIYQTISSSWNNFSFRPILYI